jgi:predicted flap endonuclease-1-like 5' DNA nuclease
VTTFLAFVILVVAVVAGYFAGRGSRPRDSERSSSGAALPVASPVAAPQAALAPAAPADTPDRLASEQARIIRSYEHESEELRRAVATCDAALVHLADLARERRQLFDALAASRRETARYRQLVIDLEDNAPSTLFGPGAPDDLKLIVGIGPVLERMLHQLGVTTFRQVAFWSEHDIDEFDAKLHEFPGRIRRDEWVTQARSLHQSKYGEPPARP